MWESEKGLWVLVNTEHGYCIVNKKDQLISLISDDSIYNEVIQKLLEEDTPIYQNILDAYSDNQ